MMIKDEPDMLEIRNKKHKRKISLTNSNRVVSQNNQERIELI